MTGQQTNIPPAQTQPPNTEFGPNGAGVNTHFALAVVAVCLSCFAGFFTIALGLAALIFSLRAQDQLLLGRLDEARRTAWWAGLFGWAAIVLSLLPIILFILFGGAILTLLGALISLA